MLLFGLNVSASQGVRRYEFIRGDVVYGTFHSSNQGRAKSVYGRCGEEGYTFFYKLILFSIQFIS